MSTTGRRPGWAVGQLEAALERTAIGDHVLEAAVAAVLRSGPGLPAMLEAGLITAEPDVDDLGGGWWADIEWLDVHDALRTGRLRATPFQAAALRTAADASGHLLAGAASRIPSPSSGGPKAHLRTAWSGGSSRLLVAHRGGPRAGHVAVVPAHLATTYLVYDGPLWLGVYIRTSPLRFLQTDRGTAEVWTVML